MHPRPLLSFCIPTYNRPKEVKAAIESILQQDAFNPKTMEILIFDDAPQAPAKTNLASLIKKYPSITYQLNTPNKGIDENILALCASAQGQFLMFLTDDDTFRPGALKKIVEVLSKHKDLHFYACGYQIVFNEKATRIHQAFTEDSLFSSDQYGKTAQLFKDTESLSGKCFAKDCLELEKYDEHQKSLYCHLILAGTALLSGTSYYSSEPLINHTIGNEVFWKYSGDYMLSDLHDLIEKVGKNHSDFIKESEKQLFSSLPYIAYINMLSPKKLTPVLRTILRKRLYSQHVFWQGLALGTVTTIKNKLKA